MTNLDWLFTATLLIAMAAGAYRGWLPQALSMLGLVLAFFAVVYLGPVVGAHLPLSGPGESLREGLGVRLHRYTFHHSGGQPAHRTVGAVFGLIGVVMICLGVSTLIELTELREESWWKGSFEKHMAESMLTRLKATPPAD